MMEPTYGYIGKEHLGERPMSQLTNYELRRIVEWRGVEIEPDEDADFNRRYAAILLKERGVG